MSPVLGDLETIFSTVSDLISLPTNVFDSRGLAENDDDSDEIANRPVADDIRRLDDQISRANNDDRPSSDEIKSALRRWLDRLSTSSIVSRIDRVQKWRNDLSKHLDDEATA